MSSPTVQVLFNGKVIQVLPFSKNTLSIGRMRENDIVIDNLAVSRFHAKLIKENSQVILEDQNSENGSFVNGRMVHKAVITATDEVVIGKHQILILPSGKETDPSGPESNLNSSFHAAQATSQPWDVSSTYAVDVQTQEKILERIREKSSALNPATRSTSENHDNEILKNDSSPTSVPRLILNHEGLTEQIILFEQKSLTIGRSGDCDIVLDQPQVSRRHALLEKSGDKIKLQDLDTGNGTFVNNQRINSCFINSGDKITIGSFHIILRIDEPKPFIKPSEKETLEMKKPSASLEVMENALPVSEPSNHSASSYITMESLAESLMENNNPAIEFENGDAEKNFSPEVLTDGVEIPFEEDPTSFDYIPPDENQLNETPYTTPSELPALADSQEFQPDSQDFLKFSDSPGASPSETLSFEIEININSLPESLRKSLQPFLDEGFRIPLDLRIVSRKKE